MKTANFFAHAGRGETFHRAIIHYLVAKHNSGDSQGLHALSARLGFHLPKGEINAQNEFHKADLALLNRASDKPIAVFEFKVDTCERELDGGYQTELYRRSISKRYPEFAAYYYVTVGLAEFEGEPADDQWRWVALDDLIALASELPEDAILQQWRHALEEEKRGRLEFARDRESTDYEFSREQWNVYLFDEIASALLKRRDVAQLIEPSAYLHGPAPDTILFFGYNPDEYAEINQGGLLSVKTDLAELPLHERAERVRIASDRMARRLSEFDPQLRRTRKKEGNSATLAKFDVGLIRDDGGFLEYADSHHATVERLAAILGALYAPGLDLSSTARTE